MLKTLFLLLLLAFGTAMFAAGALAPPAVKTPLAALAARAATLLHAPSDARAAPHAAAPAAAPAHAQAAEAASTPLASLLVPVPPPPHGRYALQAASFASRDAATSFAASAIAQDYKALVVPVSDAGQPFIVAVGDYPSPDAARADQLVVQRQLQAGVLPPVILLPAAAASAGASSTKTAAAIPDAQ
ncbi:SPOR domain-containing protein [Paraburkholderia solisilvae]|uniref:SPOR domain-containing protein n=1 Tax=Paraburkholderia solisilvae TaxID=624376 RepID=A0A6J5E579_9BURK|nr:SPOR domain-containing protein [Paraburkholderia solisilvae]CAB3760446.1 hypothetical protein LMG29739_03391 [Paraburkholderia solisilvae]